MTEVLLMAVAGGLGAVARFGLDGAVNAARAWRYPVATTLINLTGSFGLGLLAGLLAHRTVGPAVYLVVGTGFLGGYTTFSTAAYEVVRLGEQRRWTAALGHALGLLVGSVALAALGYGLAAILQA